MMSCDIYELGGLSTARTWDEVTNLNWKLPPFQLASFSTKYFGQLAETPF